MAASAMLSQPCTLLSAKDEADAFGRLRRRLLSRLVRQTLSTARFRVSLIVVLTSVLWAGMFWMFLDGFVFLKQTITNEDMYGRIVAGVFELFFAALIVMLVFSSAIILYGSLFRSREMTYLMTIPARTGRLFLHKFNEDLLLSSWGFILLGSPMLLAYGIVAEAPWYYYVLLLPFLISFVYIPVAIGAILCLLVVRSFPDHRLAILVGAGVVVAVGVAWMAWGVVNASPGDLLDAELVPGDLRAAADLGLPAVAGLVADDRPGRRRQRRPGRKRLVPGVDHLQRPVLPAGGAVDGHGNGPAGLPPDLRSGVSGGPGADACGWSAPSSRRWPPATAAVPPRRPGSAFRAAASFSGHVLGIAAAVALALTSAVLLPVALWRSGSGLVGGGGHLSAGLQRALRQDLAAETLSLRLARQVPVAPALLASPDHAADDHQGFPLVPPRSAAMVPGADFRGADRGLFLQRPQLHLRPLGEGLGEHGQLPEPRRGGAVAVDFHDPLHLSHDQPRRPAVLDPRPLGRPPRIGPLEQVLVRPCWRSFLARPWCFLATTSCTWCGPIRRWRSCTS